MGEDVKFIFRWGFVSVFVFILTGKHRTPNKILHVAWLFISGWPYPSKDTPLSLIFLMMKRPGLLECGAVNFMLFECLGNLHSYKYRVKFTDLADAPRDSMTSSLHVHREFCH